MICRPITTVKNARGTLIVTAVSHFRREISLIVYESKNIMPGLAEELNAIKKLNKNNKSLEFHAE